MRPLLAALLLTCLLPAAHSQCAPAPDSPYFFRGLSERRAEARIAADRAAYEGLLGEGFVYRGADGRTQTRDEFIAAQLTPRPANLGHDFYAIREFKLVEHRTDYTVANYLLIEGTSGKSPHTAETWMREVYEVQKGKWLLTAVEVQSEPASEASHP